MRPLVGVARWLEKLRHATWLLGSRMMAHIWLRDCDVVGRNTTTFFRPHVENRGRIVIGANVRLNSNWAPLELATGPHGHIDIGDGVFINYGTLIAAQHSVRIGANV